MNMNLTRILPLTRHINQAITYPKDQTENKRIVVSRLNMKMSDKINSVQTYKYLHAIMDGIDEVERKSGSLPTMNQSAPSNHIHPSGTSLQ